MNWTSAFSFSKLQRCFQKAANCWESVEEITSPSERLHSNLFRIFHSFIGFQLTLIQNKQDIFKWTMRQMAFWASPVKSVPGCIFAFSNMFTSWEGLCDTLVFGFLFSGAIFGRSHFEKACLPFHKERHSIQTRQSYNSWFGALGAPGLPRSYIEWVAQCTWILNMNTQ